MNPAVFEVGSVTILDGVPVHVGVDYDSITIRGATHARLSREQAETFAQLWVRASWLAGQQEKRLDDAGHLDGMRQ